jgi:hypothetical protein
MLGIISRGKGFSFMQRVIARLLVSVLLLSALAPLASAAQPAPACCIRKPVTRDAGMSGMHCHEAAGHSHDMAAMASRAPSETHSLRSRDCCASHECCRSNVRSQWAHVGPSLQARRLKLVQSRVAVPITSSDFAAPSDSHSGRSPPLA